MVIGCTFYGYIIGHISSIISANDLNSRSYYERMESIHAWLRHHGFPIEVRRRLRRYFKAYLAERSALDESAIMSDLSPELRKRVSQCLIDDAVRNHQLFAGL